MHAISLSFFLSFCLSVCLSSDYYKCLTAVKTSVAVTYLLLLLLLLRSNDNRPVSQCVYYSTPVTSLVFAVGNLCLPPEWMIYKLKLNYLRYLERERERCNEMSGSDSYSMEEQSSRTVPVREHWQQQQQQRRHSQCSSFLPPPPHFPGLVFSAGELLPEHCLPASQLIANRQLLLLLLLLTEWKHTWMSIASPLCLSLSCSHCVFVNVLFVCYFCMFFHCCAVACWAH